MIKQQEIIENIKKNLSELNEVLNQIKIADFPKSIIIESSEFRDIESFRKTEDQLKNIVAPIIYIISIENAKERKDLLDRFADFEEENKKQKENRINHSKYNKVDSHTLYVGSCLKTGFLDRLKSHLGLRNSKTYSLHLGKWDENINYTIQIKIYQITSTSINLKENKDGKAIIELIEQTVWDKLKPIFGKRSGLL